jgi:PAS domain S-box-containing protein
MPIGRPPELRMGPDGKNRAKLLPIMGNREIASWLIASRAKIEAAMHGKLGPAAPSASSQESEALRRFRTFSSAALMRGEAPPPNLEGLRVNQRRALALLESWLETATLCAGENGAEVHAALKPLCDQFALSLRTSHNGRKVAGRPRLARRVVSAAIDRVADAFIAIDTDSGAIEDANPAAGALLGVQRDALLGVSATSFVAPNAQAELWTRLDALCESEEPQHFSTTLVDTGHVPLEVEVSASSFRTRSRTLALLLARPKAPLRN